MRLVGVRHQGPYWEIGAAFERLGAWLASTGLPAAAMVAVYHDDPARVPLEQLRSDACVEVGASTPIPEGSVSIVEIPSGEYACVTHVGPYSELPHAWSAFFAALPSTGRRPACGPSFEIYRNNCSQVAEQELITELYHPLAEQPVPATP